MIIYEATTALDSKTENTIQTSIDLLKGHYTILIVGSRLSTIRNSDRIVLMQNGRILSIGNYEELMKKSKVFERMVRLQEL